MNAPTLEPDPSLLHVRGISLTEVGRAFYERSARVVAEAEEAELAVTRLQATPRGRLRISAPVSFGLRHLGPALPEFMTRCPEVTLDIDFADRFVDLIDEGYDLAVRIGTLADSSLIARRVALSRLVVCAAPAYWVRRGRPAHPQDLTGHDCLTYAYLRTPNEWLFGGPEGRIAVRVEGGLRTNNGDVSLQAALAGLGVARLPTFIVGPDLAAGRLEAVLSAYEPPPGGVYAVYPHNRHLSAKVRAFVDYLVERFGRGTGWDAA
jgi:DNA-binding transcriptional LysR family regulator